MVTEEYGSPYASYEVKGKVTDQQGEPISGIQVACDAMYVEPVYTESDGSYALSGGGFPREKIQVSFEDVDGEENGGLFATRSVSAETHQVQDGEGNWDFGVYEAEVNAELSLDQTQSFE
jgi:putative lipoprotein (rSAM/lipoprotein system)